MKSKEMLAILTARLRSEGKRVAGTWPACPSAPAAHTQLLLLSVLTSFPLRAALSSAFPSGTAGLWKENRRQQKPSL